MAEAQPDTNAAQNCLGEHKINVPNIVALRSFEGMEGKGEVFAGVTDPADGISEVLKTK